jgi:hypothetical protein
VEHVAQRKMLIAHRIKTFLKIKDEEIAYEFRGEAGRLVDPWLTPTYHWVISVAQSMNLIT